MNLDHSPLKNGKNIQQLYKYIKTDNLDGFIQLINKHPTLIYFKNNLKENLLFYTFQCASEKIATYLIANQENFLYEKNRYALTPFSNLIYTDNFQGLMNFQNLVENNIISKNQLEKNYHTNGERYNLPVLSVLKLSKHNWEIFSDLTEKFWNDSDLTIKYEDELNIAHLISKNDSTHCLNIIPYLPNNLFSDNSITYGTPLLTAATYASKDVFKAILPLSDVYTKTKLGNTVVHLGTNNQNLNIIELTKEFDFDYTQKNGLSLSPLYKAIMSRNEKCVFDLLPYYKEHILNEELFYLTQNFPKKSNIIENFLEASSPDQFNFSSSNRKELISIFSYIFYYYNEEQMKQFISSNKLSLLEHFKGDKFMRHQLYVSSIMGRKAMSFKINFLQEIGDYLSISDSDNYYSAKIINNKIEFSNSESFSNLRFNSHFCLMTALGSLPFTQLKEIYTNTNIFKKLNEEDYLLFRSILLKKNLSHTLLNVVKPIKRDFHIIPNSNLDLAIQNNIHSFFENFNNDKLRDEVEFLIEYFQDSPKFLINATVEKTIAHNDTDIINYAYRIIGNNITKKDLIIQFMEKLIAKNESNENLENFLIDNKKLNSYFFHHLEKTNIDINNIEYFNKLLAHKLPFNNFNFLFALMQSDNINKNQLIKNTLEYFDPNKYDYNVSKIENNLNKSINNNIWGTVLNHFYGSKYFNKFLSLHLINELKYLDNVNLETFDIAMNYFDDDVKPILQSISTNLVDSSKLSTSDFKERLFYILDQLNPDHEEELYIQVINSAIKNNNFTLVNLFIDQYAINVELLNLEACFSSVGMSSVFDFNFNGNVYKPFKDYLDFIENHKDKFSPAYWEQITTEFYNWLVTHPNDSIKKTEMALLFFSNIKEYILEIPDQIIINICSNILEKTSENTQSVYLKNNNNDTLEKMLNVLFENQDHEFLMNLQNDEQIKNMAAFIPLNQQAILRFHFLEERLKNKDTNKKKKKI